MQTEMLHEGLLGEQYLVAVVVDSIQASPVAVENLVAGYPEPVAVAMMWFVVECLKQQQMIAAEPC